MAPFHMRRTNIPGALRVSSYPSGTWEQDHSEPVPGRYFNDRLRPARGISRGTENLHVNFRFPLDEFGLGHLSRT